MWVCRYVRFLNAKEEITHDPSRVAVLHCGVLPFYSVNNVFVLGFSFFQILPFFIEAFRISPLLIGFSIYYKTGDDIYLDISVFVFFLFLLVLTFLALVPTGSDNPSRLEKIARYVSVYCTPEFLIEFFWWE